MVEIDINNAEELLKLYNHCLLVVSEPILKILDGKFHIIGMNVNGGKMVRYTQKTKTPNDTTFVPDPQTFTQAVKRFGKSKIKLIIGDTCEIKNENKSFSVRLMEEIERHDIKLDIPSNLKISVNIEEIKECLGDIGMFKTPGVVIHIENSRVSFSAVDQKINAKTACDCLCRSDLVHDQKFTVDTLSRVIREVSGKVDIEFGENLPVVIKQSGEIEYYGVSAQRDYD